MENASKALLIAGGILVAMLTISIFYFMFGKMSEVSEAISENTDQKELISFNSSFEAYNKKVMYGADVVSVMNKAIDNNRSYGIEYYSKPVDEKLLDYYVNIVVKYNDETFSLMYDYTKPASPSVRNEIQERFIDMLAKSDKDEEYKTNIVYKEEVDAFHKFKFTAFKCTSMTTTKKSDLKHQSASGAVGRVREMVFEVK